MDSFIAVKVLVAIFLEMADIIVTYFDANDIGLSLLWL